MYDRLPPRPSNDFLDKSGTMYTNYGADIMHFLIEKMLLKQCGNSIGQAYDALRQYMEQAVRTGNDNANLCKNFLNDHRLDPTKNLFDLVDKLDFSLSRQILMTWPDKGGLFTLTPAQRTVIHSLNESRGGTVHDHSSQNFREKEYEHWCNGRADLQAALVEFASYIQRDTAAGIRKYCDGTAKEYIPPAKDVRGIAEHLFASGYPVTAIKTIMEAPNGGAELLHFYTGHSREIEAYIEAKRWSAEAHSMIRTLAEYSQENALRYLGMLSGWAYVNYIQNNLIRRYPAEKERWHFLSAQACPDPVQSRSYMRKACAYGSGEAAAEITARSGEHFADIAAKPSDIWFTLTELDRKVIAQLQPEHREALAAIELAAYQKAETDLEKVSAQKQLEWLKKNTAHVSWPEGSPLQPIYDRIRDRAGRCFYKELGQKVKDTEPDGKPHPELEATHAQLPANVAESAEYKEYAALLEEFKKQTQILLAARRQAEIDEIVKKLGQYEQNIYSALEELRGAYDALDRRPLKEQIQQVGSLLDRLSDKKKQNNFGGYYGRLPQKDQSEKEIRAAFERCQEAYDGVRVLNDQLQKKSGALRKRQGFRTAFRYIFVIVTAVLLVIGSYAALKTTLIRRADEAMLQGDLVGGYTVLDKYNWFGILEARRVECLKLIRQRLFVGGFFGELMEEPRDSNYISIQAVENGADPIGDYEKKGNYSIGIGGYSIPLYGLEGKQPVAIARGDSRSGDNVTSSVRVLCTDGTVLEGSVSWVDHPKVTAAQLADIAKVGITLEQTAVVENLKGVWIDVDHWSGSEVFRYLLKDNTIQGGSIQYENIVGFLPGKDQGSLEYPSADQPVTEDVASYFEPDAEDLFDGSRSARWIAVDGTWGHEDEPEKGNDTLFYGYDSTPDACHGDYITVYDDEVKDWL